MSVGIVATVIVRVVAGVAERVGALVVGPWVGIDVAASVEDAGVGVAVAAVGSGVFRDGGVGMMFVGDGVLELGSAVARTEVGVAAGIDVSTEQAVKTMRIGTSAPIWSLVIRLLLYL